MIGFFRRFFHSKCDDQIKDLQNMRDNAYRKVKSVQAGAELMSQTIAQQQDCIKKVFMCNPRWHEICKETTIDKYPVNKKVKEVIND